MPLDFGQLQLPLFAQQGIQLELEVPHLQHLLPLLQLVVGLEAIFRQSAVLLHEVLVGDEFVRFVLAEETAVCADELLVLNADQVCLFGVQEASLEF
jgi:hypothetical protein